MAGVLGDRLGYDDAVSDAVYGRIVGVRLDEEWSPVELHGRVEILQRQRFNFCFPFLVHGREFGISLTSMRNTEREPFLVRDVRSGADAEWTRQIMDSHWFLFSESPTNIRRFPRSFSRSTFASYLVIDSAPVKFRKSARQKGLGERENPEKGDTERGRKTERER